MKAVIVAAGMSTRLKKVTKSTPKSLLDFGGKSLLMRSVESLRFYGIDDIFVVVGHNYQEIQDELKDTVQYVHNPWYATTNNMASLWCALPFLTDDDFLYLHSDLLYHPELLKNCLSNSNGEILLLVEEKECGLEEMKVLVDDDRLLHSSKEIELDESFGEWTGIARFTKEGGKQMFDASLALLYQNEFNVYDTAAISNLVEQGVDIRIELTKGLPWIEIDIPEDYEIAQQDILPKILEKSV